MGKCQQTPDWGAYDQASSNAQSSIDPAGFFGCTPGPRASYGNQAFVEDNLMSVAPDEAQMCVAPPATEQAQAPAPPRLGLSAYDVVPDDFVGPLAPGQIRQGQRNELDRYGFGNMNVVGDDFVGPLQPNQMRQADYARMQDGWLRMGQGQGLALNGSAGDQDAYKQMMSQSLSHSGVFRDLFSTMANDQNRTVTMELGRNQPGIWLDGYEYSANAGGQQRNTQTLDLSDLEQLPTTAPAAHPDAMNRTQNMIHAMEEARVGNTNPGATQDTRYRAGHAAGIAAENRYRQEQGQGGLLQNEPANVPGGTQWTYSNGHRETWQSTGDRITGVTYP